MKSLEETGPSEDETRQEDSKMMSLPELPNDFGFSLASFREELDNITKSLDDEVDFHELLNEARRMSRSSETEERPPPSESRFTPSAKQAEQVATPEPTPVKTPGSYQPYVYDDNGEFLSTVAEDDHDDDDLVLIDRLDRQAHKIRRLEEENRNLREQVRSLRGANDAGSPGSVFVDELVELMDLSDDQYANLRRIMDTYFQQQQQTPQPPRRLRRSRFY